MIIKIGMKFTKQLNKGKICECVLVDIVSKHSLASGEIFHIEYYAKSETYGMGKAFQVAKTTILRGLKP